MLDTITNWVLQNILGGIAELFQQVLTALGSILDDIFIVVVEFNNSVTREITNFTLVFGVFLIIFFCLEQFFTIYGLETAGDPDGDPIDIFVRGSQAIAIAVSADFIFDFFMDFSSVFTKDMLSFFVDNTQTSTGVMENLQSLLSVPSNFTAIPAVIIIIAVVFIIAVIVFSISAGIRGAELIFFKMLFPFFAADLVTTSRERWNAFFTSYVVTWLAYVLQIISFKMFGVTLTYFVTSSTDDFWKIFAITIGWIVLMLRAPKWLEKFTYSSGLSNGVRSGASTIMMGMRMRR